MSELVNVAGTDEYGRLCVFVSNPGPLDAVTRARLYEAAPALLAAAKAAIEHYGAGQPVTRALQAAIAKAGGGSDT